MPYLMRAAVDAHRSSLPMMRAMVLEFPEDPTCRSLDRQYMLGDSLLVSPVFHDTRAEYYLPEGEWTHLLTGEVRAGGRWYFDELDYFGVPLWIRPNALVAIGSEAAEVDYDYAAGVRLVCGKLDGASPAACELVDRRGSATTRFELVQHGRSVSVNNLSGRSDYRIHLPWASAVSEVTGGVEVAGAAGLLRGAAALGGVEIAATSPCVSFTWR
jgi:alpha-D-xyloside xylohydrolase